MGLDQPDQMVMAPISASLLSRLAGILPVGRAAGFLPASSGFGFELGLSGAVRRRPDISVRIEPEDGSFRLFSGPPLAEAVCRLWDQPDGLAARSVDALWLEYDDPGPDQPWTASLAFCRLANSFHSLPEAEAEEVLGLILGLARAERHLAGTIFRRLRPMARLRHVGFPLGRRVETTRLCFTTTRTEWTACLDRLGQGAGKSALQPLVDTLSDESCEIVLHLDAGHALGPRIGVEIMPSDHAGWNLLLDGLVARGLCHPDDAELIRRWSSRPAGDPPPGLSRRLPAPVYWDDAMILRTASHVKLSAEPGRPLAVKAYLFAGLLWDHQQLRGAA